jgi:spermidine synthase
VVLGNGRNYLLHSHEKFDVMTFEPPSPDAAGVVNLYSHEFYQLCRGHLPPGGMMAQWVPLSALGDDGARMVIHTFQLVFPFATLWQGSPNNLATYTVSVLDDSVRALYYYSSAHRIRAVLPDNHYTNQVLVLDVEGIRNLQEAARSANPKALEAWAMRLILQSRYHEAVNVLQQAALLAPQYPLPKLPLGVVAWSEGRIEEANRQIQQGMDLLGTDVLRKMTAVLLQESGVLYQLLRKQLFRK